MAIIKIPLEPSPDNYSFKISVSDNSYIFNIYWNGRDERWILKISDSNNNMICASPLVVNHDLFGRLKKEELPENALALLNLASTEECEKEELGTTCSLYLEV
jgi:hypothetical protein